ncbi:MAG: hypothetical protein WC057_08025 [Dehalococcoidales bacterium]|jgi:hypothetical protein
MPSDNPYKNALDIQDACNSCGVIQQFARDVRALSAEVRNEGKGTDDLNQHPVVILYLDKLCDLARYRDYRSDKTMTQIFTEAFDVCWKKSGKENEQSA